MKLLFLTKVDFSDPDLLGVRKKICGQVDALNRSGMDADLIYIDHQHIQIREKGVDRELMSLVSGGSRFWFYQYKLFTFLRASKGYDTIVIRHFQMLPIFLIQLWILKVFQWPELKVVLEIPTYPYVLERKSTSLRARLEEWVDQWSCKYLMSRSVDRILTYSRFDRIWGIETIQTDNGIAIQGTEKLNQIPEMTTFRMVAVSGLERWQGIDRVIQGMAHVRDQAELNISVTFHIVGSGSVQEELEQLVDQLALRDAIVFHGPMSGADLADLLKDCHVAVGSLGRHRTGNEYGQTTTLKAREYALGGIPFFMSMVDHDFGPEYPFCLQVPSTEDPIQISDVVNWYSALKAEHPGFAKRMYDDAVKRLTWDTKLGPLLTYLQH